MVVYIAFVFIMIMVIVDVILLLLFISGSMVTFSVALVDFSWSFLKLGVVVDVYSVSFSLIVLLVSGIVLLFSVYYMEDCKFMNYFIMLVIVFIMGMMVLVYSGSFLVSYLGWDILGVVSFLLIIFYGNYVSVGGSLVTMFMNRVGDCMMVVMFIWVILVDQEFMVWGVSGLAVLSFFIIMAVVTKSAQFPYSVWLPLAMAAPTPVSALVHSSTLVTAGVYFVIRWHNLLDASSMGVLMVMSMMTIIYSGLVIMGEGDIKKVVALSTLMHLGIMMGVAAMGNWELSFIHMSLHALYKSMLFVGIGIYIVNMSHDQSFSSYSSVMGFSNLNSMVIMISVVSLAGLPYFSGFYTKEIVLALLMNSSISVVMWVMGVVGMSVSLMYSLRLLSVFIGSSVEHFSLGNVLVGMCSLSMLLIVYSILSAVLGVYTLGSLSWWLEGVFISGMEVVLFYGLMVVVLYLFWGINFIWVVNMGFMVDFVVEVISWVYFKFIGVVSLLDIKVSEFVGDGAVMVGLESSNKLVWLSMVSSLMVYSISFIVMVSYASVVV
nr:NADH dehydrogenase subunit 5 [Moniliformis sp. XH-2020]